MKNALVGFSHSFKHLDDHMVEIETDPRGNSIHIIRPAQRRILQNEGMPIHNVPSQFGHLEIEFDVVFPTSLSEIQRQKLAEILSE